MKKNYFLHGGGQVNAVSQVTLLTTSWGGGVAFLDLKHHNSLHKWKRNISQETYCLVLCGYPEHVDLHESDE